MNVVRDFPLLSNNYTKNQEICVYGQLNREKLKKLNDGFHFFLEILPGAVFARIIIYLQCIRFPFFGFDSWLREGFLFHILILIYICMIYINI